MSTRRELAIALMGLPVIAGAAAQPEYRPYSEESARIISYTLYAEARGEPLKGKMAVAAVIQTRSRLLKISMPEVCLQDKQFSCWNDITAVPESFILGAGLRSSDIVARSDCYSIAWVLMSSSRKWEFLTHFYNPAKVTPDWASEMKGVHTIGNHVFGYIL